ncbi:histidine kinase [Kitasatospora sp. NPDC089797]|uniref:sensor histidine kinase n=1 Tax=Kitasatospora sp. NPDC089797 TaxID=3155298 RepID=UPI00341D7E5C
MGGQDAVGRSAGAGRGAGTRAWWRDAWPLSPWAVDVLLAAAALVDALVCARRVLPAGGGFPHTVVQLDPTTVALGTAAALLLLLRRRWPVPVLAVVLPVMVVTTHYHMVALLVAVFTLAERSSRGALVGAVLYVGATNLCAYYQVSQLPPDLLHGPAFSAYRLEGTACVAGAMAALGRLVSSRRELARRMTELREAQEHERELHAQAVLARERAQLAREMHDVVSHQVSLIAVRAGALQVGADGVDRADGADTREAARTIRELSVTTLDELRHMVTLLRASGSRDAEIAPQPTAAQLADLVAGSGLDARLVGGVPEDASATVQRAVYRIVQESLTNVRKHAPGASAVVEVRRSGPGLEVTVTNTPATRPGLLLPGSRTGIIGLRERAENLDGTLTSGPTPDHGYRVHAALPDRRH